MAQFSFIELDKAVVRVIRMWLTGEGSGKPLQYSWLENPMKYEKEKR